MRLARFVMRSALVLAAGLLVSPPTAAGDDQYLAGYAAAVLEREFNARGDAARVKGGVVTVDGARLGPADRDRVITVLGGIPGVVRVELAPPASTPAGPGASAAAAAAPPEPSGPLPLPTGFMPGGALFKPLIADPRWPHFSAAYHHYVNDPDFRDVGAVSFGETFALYRGDIPALGQWDVGLQAGVFSIFDLDAESKDLINADYFVAAFAGYRYRDFSALGRLFHQSSHLGDEFLLRTRLQRINLSYESVDLRLSLEFLDAFRIYLGGGFLFDQDPSHLDPWSTQAGLEFRSPWAFFGERVRPVAAVDLQHRQETDWRPNISARAGVQFDSIQVLGRSLQLLVEYFNGQSPSGQFYTKELDYLGLGAHFHF